MIKGAEGHSSPSPVRVPPAGATTARSCGRAAAAAARCAADRRSRQAAVDRSSG